MPFVQCFTEDDSGNSGFIQGDYVIHIAHSATSHQVEIRKLLQHFFIQIYRRTFQHSITTNISTNNFLNTFIYIVFEKWEKLTGAFVFPAVYSNLMFLDVCSEDYFLTAIYFQPMAEQLRIFHGNASACHHLSTAFKSYFQIFVTLYSTAKIYY